MSALHSAIAYLAPMADPKPGGYNGPAVGTGAPPGGAKFTTILGWVMFTVSGLAVLGILITAGMMFVARQRGGGSEHAASLGWIAVGCVIAGSATGLVGVLIS